MTAVENPHLRLVWSQEAPERNPAAELRRECKLAGWLRVMSLDEVQLQPGASVVCHQIGGQMEIYYVPPGEPSRWTIDDLIERAFYRNRAA